MLTSPAYHLNPDASCILKLIHTCVLDDMLNILIFVSWRPVHFSKAIFLNIASICPCLLALHTRIFAIQNDMPRGSMCPQTNGRSGRRSRSFSYNTQQEHYKAHYMHYPRMLCYRVTCIKIRSNLLIKCITHGKRSPLYPFSMCHKIKGYHLRCSKINKDKIIWYSVMERQYYWINLTDGSTYAFIKHVYTDAIR